jgi:hypothetical protein
VSVNMQPIRPNAQPAELSSMHAVRRISAAADAKKPTNRDLTSLFPHGTLQIDHRISSRDQSATMGSPLISWYADRRVPAVCRTSIEYVL